MSTLAPLLSAFEADVLNGLTQRQKELPARYFYDEVGSALFEVITRLPEYGLTRADERLLSTHAFEIARSVEGNVLVAELGSGSGTKTAQILRALADERRLARYCPIDISPTALEHCTQLLAPYGEVRPMLADYMDGLARVAYGREPDETLMLLFLGSTIGNFERTEIPAFFQEIRQKLQTSDLFLLGADLIKPEAVLLAAYNDPLGVTAAFNLNVLRRVNVECGAEFDLRSFAHQARWNALDRRIEMHLVSRKAQTVAVRGLGIELSFLEGETIWTESSHKFTVRELDAFAKESGFEVIETWTDEAWPFAESLWRAR